VRVTREARSVSDEICEFHSSAVELRGQFKAIETLVRRAVPLRLLHGSREAYKSSGDNGLTESNSTVPEAKKEH
jgi:hypothetical protein